MKRFISALLLVCVLLGCAPVFSSASDINSGAENENILNLLSVTGITDKDFKADDSLITRGELAGLLIRAGGMDKYVPDELRYSFSDVNSETPYASEIAIAREMRLINGYSDGTFRAENSVSVFEAAICFIRLLGYEAYALAKGGFPGGYYEVLRETKLLGGILAGYSESLKRSDAVILISNALHTKVLKRSAFGGSVEYSTSDRETLLYTAFNISYDEGVVNGVDITNLYGENDLTPYRVYIGEKIYNALSFNMNNLLGYYVRAYYISGDYDESIVLAYALDNKNNEKIIKLSDIADISGGKIIVETEDGKKENFSYNSDSAIIYNGTNTTERFTMDIFKNSVGEILKGELKLLDNNGDKKADVIFIDAYEEMIIGKVNSFKSTVHDYYDYERSMVLSTDTNEPYVLIYNNDEEVEFSALKEGLSLIVYTSKDDSHQTLVKAYISSESAEGKIESVSEADNGKIVTIDGKDYVLSSYAEDNSSSVIVGRTVNATLNAKGEIARIEYSTNPGDYLFSMVCAVWKSDGFEGGYFMRLMNTDGAISDIPVSDKVLVDNRSYNLSSANDCRDFVATLKEASRISGFEREGAYLYQIIKYGVDAGGKIKHIDTTLNNSGEKDSQTSLSENNELYSERIVDGEYLATLSMIGEKIILTSDSVIFMVPLEGEESDFEKYGVTNKSYFASERDYTVTYFSDAESGFEAKYLMSEYKKSRLSNDFIATYITKITDTVDEDNLPCKKIYGYRRGATVEILANKEIVSNSVEDVSVNDLKAGDIIYYVADSDEKLDQFIIMYKRDTNKTYADALIAERTNNKVVLAHAVSSTPKGIKLVYETGMGGSTVLNDELAFKGDYTVFNNVIYNVTVIDDRTKQAKTGSYLDVIGYEESADDYSVVVAHCASSGASMSARQLIREIFVYK